MKKDTYCFSKYVNYKRENGTQLIFTETNMPEVLTNKEYLPKAVTLILEMLTQVHSAENGKHVNTLNPRVRMHAHGHTHTSLHNICIYVCVYLYI